MTALPPPEILLAFGVPGEEPRPLGRGRIHLTFRCGPLVLQRLNPVVFPDPAPILANAARITGHLRRRLAEEGLAGAEGRVLQGVPALSGAVAVPDSEGTLWRATRYLEGGRPVGPGLADAEAAARAFGGYLRRLADLDPHALQVVIPRFHDTPARLAAFRHAWKADPLGRAGDMAPLGPDLARLEPLASALDDPALPLRIAHDDTKLDNVLLDARTGEGLCVLDLDTTQPGSWLADFGDLARSACNPLGEDGRPPGILPPDLDCFAALARGFLPELAPHLTAGERARLALAPAVIAYELGLRFLTDHLEGDRIFAVEAPGDNLRRGAVQLALAVGFRAAEPELRRQVDRALQG